MQLGWVKAELSGRRRNQVWHEALRYQSLQRAGGRRQNVHDGHGM